MLKVQTKLPSSNDPTAHAEIVAIREACKKLNTFNLTGCDLYTSCEPCPMCLSAIYWSHIDNIFYANTRDDAKKIDFDDSLIYSEISKKNEDRQIPIKQMLREDALKLLRLWSKKTDKIRILKYGFLPYTMKWLELVLRWGHVLFAILWVGNSFLFNYLDNKLNKIFQVALLMERVI